jgi:WD40 repeat protein
MLVRATSNGHPFQRKSSVMIWDVADGGKRVSWRETFELPEGRVYAVSIQPGGRMLVAIANGKPRHSFPNMKDSDPGQVQLWDGATKQVQTLATGHRKAVVSLAFSPDGRMLATGSDDTTIRLWDLSARIKAAAKND